MLHAGVGLTSVQYRHTAIADLMLRGNTVAMISNLWRPAIIVVIYCCDRGLWPNGARQRNIYRKSICIPILPHMTVAPLCTRSPVIAGKTALLLKVVSITGYRHDISLNSCDGDVTATMNQRSNLISASCQRLVNVECYFSYSTAFMRSCMSVVCLSVVTKRL